MSDNTVIDLAEFLDRVQDDKDLLLELFDIFTQDFQDKRILLGQAVAKKDFEEIKSIGHSLKGASGNISAKALRATFLEIETMGKTSQLTNVDKVLAAMDRQFVDLQKRIEEIKSEFQKSG